MKAPEPIPMRPQAWTKAVREAELPATSKLLAYTYATYADFEDGGNCRPGDKRLAADCERSVRTIKRWRRPLVAQRWIQLQRRGLSAGRSGGGGIAAIWQLTQPPNEGTAIAEAAANEGTTATPAARKRGQPRPNEGTPGDRMTGHQRQPTSSVTSSGPRRQVNANRERAAAVIRQHGNADDDEIDQLLDQLDGPRVGNLAGVVTVAIKNGSFDQRLAALRERVGSSGVAQQLAELRNGPRCPHGDPGGEALHPVSGEPLCPSCRAIARAAAK